MGTSVSSAGDVNGDGFSDVIVGAPFSSISYVVFGKASGFNASVDLGSLAEPDGFRLVGASGERSGFSVSGAGDVNGDGFDDIIIGAFLATHNGTNTGSSYVVFGKQSGFSSPLNLTTLSATDGFRIDGTGSGRSGNSVAGAGDVNGDGFDDVVIGASRAATLRGSTNITDTGAAYVVFGQASFSNPLLLSALDGSNGFRLNGNALGDRFGFSVSGAGDINADGFADVVVGAPLEDENNVWDFGRCYVLFGKSTGFSPSRDVSDLDGVEGFKITGLENDKFPNSVAGAGDINGDGLADLVTGADTVFSDLNNQRSGIAIIAYSRVDATTNLYRAFPAQLGFTLHGALDNDSVGYSVSGLGDINGDGSNDVIVGARGANSDAGATYVAFGSVPATSTATYKGRSRAGDAPPVEPGSTGDGSISPNAARARIDFSGGTNTSQETVILTRGTSGMVTGIKEVSTADIVWQITTDRVDFGTAEVTLTYRDAEIARMTNTAESDLRMYKSESPDGPWTPLATTVNTAKNEATATVTEFSYFLLGDSAGLPVALTGFQVE